MGRFDGLLDGIESQRKAKSDAVSILRVREEMADNVARRVGYKPVDLSPVMRAIEAKGVDLSPVLAAIDAIEIPSQADLRPVLEAIKAIKFPVIPKAEKVTFDDLKRHIDYKLEVIAASLADSLAPVPVEAPKKVWTFTVERDHRGLITTIKAE